jgi:hypothetical protein
MEDWILQDRVPQFTVRGNIRSSTTTGSSRRRKPATISTFWRQLKQTIPELSSRTEFELEGRYNALAAADAAVENFSSSPATPFITCGQSPQVLTNWCLGDVEKKSGNANNSDSSAARIMMHGSLSNGSSILFPLQSAGIVGASSFISNLDNNDNDNNKGAAETDFLWLMEEDNCNDDAYRMKYVEASGGCIYELGTPKPNAMMLVKEDEEKSNFLAGFQAIELKQAKEQPLSSTTSTRMALSAVIASSLLSASLAFIAGQESSMPLQSNTIPIGIITPSKNAVLPKQQQQQQPLQAIAPAVLGSGMKYERSVQRDGTQKIVELSTSEQRASQELRVYREERRLKDLQEERSDADERLIALKEREAKQGPEELSIREQRALELKIGGDKRKILRMQESLTRDKTKLKELQDEEATQQQQQQQLF